jgi:hypothetical protein
MRRLIIPATIVFLALVSCKGCGTDDNTNKKWKTISSSNGNSSMIESDDTIKPGGFAANLPDGFQQPSDDVGKRLLKEYGAVFVTHGGTVAPGVVVFKDAAAVTTFQSSANGKKDSVGGISLELQAPAMQHLKDAVAEASKSGVTITPRGADAAKRSYEDTVELWASRVKPGLAHWAAAGRIPAADVTRINALSPYDQVPEIFKLEDQGIYFSKDFAKSIIYSVAPPGASQHLSMLALDVSEFDNAKVRDILANHGWFQTVLSDLPHFTFLGVPQGDLPKLGLKKVTSSGRTFWVPDI